MKHKLALLLILILSGCTTAPKNTLTQISTIDALLAGAYDGQMTLGKLKTRGDFGIGTFDALDGELILLDNTVYQARADGSVHIMPDGATTPFATVVQFDPDQSIPLIGPFTEKGLEQQIDQLAPNRNLFLAVRIDGCFDSIKIRSVPKQTKPYPPLADVAEQQTVFEHTDIAGTLLGFRCPAFVKGINVPNYHLHFISNDRTIGGHVLDLSVTKATLRLDRCNKFFMELTERNDFSALDLTQDRSLELEKVEQ